MKRERPQLSRGGIVAAGLTFALAAAGTVAYSMPARRSPAAAGVPTATPSAAPVALTATVSDDQVTYGTRVRVVGEIRDAAGAPVSGQVVEIVTAPVADRSDETVLGSATSDAAGEVAASFRPREASDVWLRFAGGDGLAEATSSAVPIDVSSKVTMSTATVRTRKGWTTAVRGSVAPATPGAPIRLDRMNAGAWRKVSSARLTASGAYSFTVRSTKPGTHTYRVLRPGDAALAPAAVVQRVRVRPGPPPRVRPRPPGGSVRGRLLVAGDSFAFYLGKQLRLARHPQETTIDSRHSSGLSRPDFFDWNAAARAAVRSGPGGVVLFLGANDCQPLQVAATGRWVESLTPAWVAEYRRRAAELMATYAAGGARPVYWVGLPIVRKPDMAACYRTINAATAAAARGVPRVTWVDSWSVYAVRGRYSDRVGGVVARQEDGIHLTFAGTELLTRKVFALLR